jgi:DNA polymerase III delta prime subunit
MSDQYLWVEKYRPATIDECILPEKLKQTFKEYVATGELPTFLFSGTAGVGKTTVARALCNEVGADVLFINGSDEGRSIDTLRTTIKGFASTVSLTDAKKVVILDEADYMTAASVQPALRGFIEEFSNNCRFIFTCNFKNKIIEPLHSRCAVIDFKIDNAEKPAIAAGFFKRVTQILKTEGIDYDTKVVVELINKHFPDYRRILNELQRYSVSGKIDAGLLVNMSDESYKTLVDYLKDKDFKKTRQWIAQNSDIETSSLFDHLYDKASDYLDPASIPTMVLVLADYQYKDAFVANHELNTMAAMTEIMMQCKFK